MFINECLAKRVNEIERDNKSPWLVVLDERVIHVTNSRTHARTWNDISMIKGSVKKYDASLIEFEETNVSNDVVTNDEGNPSSTVVTANVKTKIDVLRLSTIERPTKRVWVIADEMTKNDANVKRKDIIARCVNEGIAFYTARTQYQQYFETLREQRTREATNA